jgi:hypothetical protein
MKKLILLWFILLSTFELQAQDKSQTTSSGIIKKRNSFSINLGANYYADFWKKNFGWDTNHMEREISYSKRQGNLGSTFIPGISFHAGMVYAFQINKYFSVESGLMYFSRRSNRIYNSDTSERNIVNAFNTKYDSPLDYGKELASNRQQLEIPLYFCYTHNRLSALVGIRLMLFSVLHTRKTQIDNSVEKGNVISYPFEEGSQIMDYTIPSVKFRYLINRKKIPVSVYCSADWLQNKDWDLSAGIQLGIYSK